MQIGVVIGLHHLYLLPINYFYIFRHIYSILSSASPLCVCLFSWAKKNLFIIFLHSFILWFNVMSFSSFGIEHYIPHIFFQNCSKIYFQTLIEVQLLKLYKIKIKEHLNNVLNGYVVLPGRIIIFVDSLCLIYVNPFSKYDKLP